MLDFECLFFCRFCWKTQTRNEGQFAANPAQCRLICTGSAAGTARLTHAEKLCLIAAGKAFPDPACHAASRPKSEEEQANGNSADEMGSACCRRVDGDSRY